MLTFFLNSFFAFSKTLTDPCEVANETVPFEPEARYVNCDQPSGTQYCDRYIVPGWYRYSERMWDQCPSLGKCGAVYPYWLNGMNNPNTRRLCGQQMGHQICLKLYHMTSNKLFSRELKLQN